MADSARVTPRNPSRWHNCFFLCEITGDTATPSAKTSEIAFFAEPDLPHDLSIDRTTPTQLRRMFAHHHNLLLPTEFD